jgi:hypothetical protein
MSYGQARFYPGVRDDFRLLANPTEPAGNSAVLTPVVNIAFGVFDMPFSGAFETLLLPADCISAATEKHEKPAPDNTPQPTPGGAPVSKSPSSPGAAEL